MVCIIRWQAFLLEGSKTTIDLPLGEQFSWKKLLTNHHRKRDSSITNKKLVPPDFTGSTNNPQSHLDKDLIGIIIKTLFSCLINHAGDSATHFLISSMSYRMVLYILAFSFPDYHTSVRGVIDGDPDERNTGWAGASEQKQISSILRCKYDTRRSILQASVFEAFRPLAPIVYIQRVRNLRMQLCLFSALHLASRAAYPATSPVAFTIADPIASSAAYHATSPISFIIAYPVASPTASPVLLRLLPWLLL